MQKSLQKPTQAARLAFAYRNLNNHFYNIPIKLKYVYDSTQSKSVPTVAIDVEAETAAETAAETKQLASKTGTEVNTLALVEEFRDGRTKKMPKEEDEVDPMEKKGWATLSPSGLMGYVTIEDTWADLMSHHTVEVTAAGKPVRIEPYVYVDEQTCIGCTLCATTAPNTFMIEKEYGRARVMRQGFDDFDTVEKAMATCPVNCIELVGWEDLVALEMERQGGQIDTNSYWVKLEGMLYFNADTMAKENKRQAQRLKDLVASWAEKKKR